MLYAEEAQPRPYVDIGVSKAWMAGQAERSAQINVTNPSRRIRRPHPSGDLRAALAFDHRYIELAL
jgi:hypothetical protein